MKTTECTIGQQVTLNNTVGIITRITKQRVFVLLPGCDLPEIVSARKLQPVITETNLVPHVCNSHNELTACQELYAEACRVGYTPRDAVATPMTFTDKCLAVASVAATTGLGWLLVSLLPGFVN